MLYIKYLEVAQKLLKVGKSESVLRVYVLYFDSQRFAVCFSLFIWVFLVSKRCSQLDPG